MGFNVSCSPGKDAAVGYVRVAEHMPTLVLYLDPVNLAIQLPPFPGGDQLLVKFCRELAREATKLADALEDEKQATSGPRHLLAEDEPAARATGRDRR